MAAPNADRINKRAAKDKAFLARALKNPGLRAKLDPKYLNPAQRKTRALNTRLNTPIAPGSSTTERDLAHEAQAATTVRYGPQDRAIAQQLGVSQQTERDTGQLYDQYRQALQQQQQNVALYQAGAQQALAQTAQGITGLGQQQAAQMQQQADAGAAQQGVAQAGQIGDLANQALAVRQGVMGTFQGQQALQGAAASQYASGQANVVAPGQKLTALAQARGRTRDISQKQTDLETEKGAYNESFRDTRRQDEFKNQLAVQVAGVQAGKAAADIAANDPAAVGTRTAATEEAKQATKYGMSIHQWRTLGPKGRANVIANSSKTKTDGNDVITGGALAGKTKQWVRDHPGAADKLVTAYNNRSGKPKSETTTSKEAFRQRYGVDLQPTSAHNRARDSVQNSQTAFGQVGKVTTRKDGSKKRVTTDEVVQVLRGQGVSNLWIRAGLEMARGGLTPGTAARIHKAGYSVSTLGYKMRRAGSSPTGSRSGTAGAPAAGATTGSSQSRR